MADSQNIYVESTILENMKFVSTDDKMATTKNIFADEYSAVQQL